MQYTPNRPKSPHAGSTSSATQLLRPRWDASTPANSGRLAHGAITPCNSDSAGQPESPSSFENPLLCSYSPHTPHISAGSTCTELESGSCSSGAQVRLLQDAQCSSTSGGGGGSGDSNKGSCLQRPPVQQGMGRHTDGRHSGRAKAHSRQEGCGSPVAGACCLLNGCAAIPGPAHAGCWTAREWGNLRCAHFTEGACQNCCFF